MHADPAPEPQPLTMPSKWADAPQSAGRSSSRRRRPVKLARLYPQANTPSPADEHVAVLIWALSEAATRHPELKRRWIPKEDLEKFYANLVAVNGWTPQSWTAMGRVLKNKALRRRTKIGSRSVTVYSFAKAFNGGSR